MAPPEVAGLLDAVTSVVGYASTALDIGLGILRVVRTFTPGQLDVIRPLVAELLKAVNQLVGDLRSVGLYAHTGDLRQLRSAATLTALRGGYAAYERRWIARLTDRQDLRRPDFSPSTSVVALFVYTAVDLGFVNGVADPATVQPLRQLVGAFGRLLGVPAAGGRNAALPAAAEVTVGYPFEPTASGTPTSPSVELARALAGVAGRESAVISWAVAPAPGSPGAEPEPPLPPGGWLVEVCCYAGGFGVGYVAPTPSSTGTGGESSTAAPAATAYTTGLYYEGDTGTPLRIWGGADAYEPGPEVDWTGAWDGETLRRGATPVYFYRDAGAPEVIAEPYGVDRERGIYYNARRFFVGRGSIADQALRGGRYTFELRREALPLYAPITPEGRLDRAAARAPEVVYVRVTAVSGRVTDSNHPQLKVTVAPRRSPAEERSGWTEPFAADDLGPPSEPVTVTLPAPEDDLYGRALQVAVAVALLSRSDLTPRNAAAAGRAPTADEEAEEDGFRPTGLELYGAGLAAEALPGRPQDYWAARDTGPDAWGRDFYGRVVAAADALMRARGSVPREVTAAARPAAERLLAWTWAEGLPAGAPRGEAARTGQTILDSLTAPRREPGTGGGALARNPFSLAPWWDSGGARTPASLIDAALEAFPRAGYGPRAYWAYQPVVYAGGATPRVYYVRSLIPDSVYGDARAILAIAGAAGVRTDGWVAWRPFASTSPWGGAARALAQVGAFMGAVTAGLGTVSDAVDSVIQFLEGRVNELQETLRRLDTYLALPLTVALPDGVVLPLVVNGTAGVVAGLTAAGNKPSDGPTAYAGGLVIIAGGLPSLLTDLILYLVAGSGGGESEVPEA